MLLTSWCYTQILSIGSSGRWLSFINSRNSRRANLFHDNFLHPDNIYRYTLSLAYDVRPCVRVRSLVCRLMLNVFFAEAASDGNSIYSLRSQCCIIINMEINYIYKAAFSMSNEATNEHMLDKFHFMFWRNLIDCVCVCTVHCALCSSIIIVAVDIIWFANFIFSRRSSLFPRLLVFVRNLKGNPKFPYHSIYCLMRIVCVCVCEVRARRQQRCSIKWLLVHGGTAVKEGEWTTNTAPDTTKKKRKTATTTRTTTMTATIKHNSKTPIFR